MATWDPDWVGFQLVGDLDSLTIECIEPQPAQGCAYKVCIDVAAALRSNQSPIVMGETIVFGPLPGLPGGPIQVSSPPAGVSVSFPFGGPPSSLPNSVSTGGFPTRLCFRVDAPCSTTDVRVVLHAHWLSVQNPGEQMSETFVLDLELDPCGDIVGSGRCCSLESQYTWAIPVTTLSGDYLRVLSSVQSTQPSRSLKAEILYHALTSVDCGCSGCNTSPENQAAFVAGPGNLESRVLPVGNAASKWTQLVGQFPPGSGTHSSEVIWESSQLLSAAGGSDISGLGRARLGLWIKVPEFESSDCCDVSHTISIRFSSVGADCSFCEHVVTRQMSFFSNGTGTGNPGVLVPGSAPQAVPSLANTSLDLGRKEGVAMLRALRGDTLFEDERLQQIFLDAIPDEFAGSRVAPSEALDDIIESDLELQAAFQAQLVTPYFRHHWIGTKFLDELTRPQRNIALENEERFVEWRERYNAFFAPPDGNRTPSRDTTDTSTSARVDRSESDCCENDIDFDLKLISRQDNGQTTSLGFRATLSAAGAKIYAVRLARTRIDYQYSDSECAYCDPEPLAWGGLRAQSPESAIGPFDASYSGRPAALTGSPDGFENPRALEWSLPGGLDFDANPEEFEFTVETPSVRKLCCCGLTVCIDFALTTIDAECTPCVIRVQECVVVQPATPCIEPDPCAGYCDTWDGFTAIWPDPGAFFSPSNQDGVNDVWVLGTTTPECKYQATAGRIKIFNRYGKTVYHNDWHHNCCGFGDITWDGVANVTTYRGVCASDRVHDSVNGQLVPSGTYWALVKLEACGVEEERLFYLQVL